MVVRVRSATVTAAMGRLIEGGGERHRGAKDSTIHKKNVRRAVTRRAYRVLGQDRATIGGQICLRNPAVGAGAAIRGEGGQSARGVSRGGAGNPRDNRKPTLLTTRDLIRIRYIIWKVRARCGLVERLRARAGPGRLRGWSERALHVAKRKEMSLYFQAHRCGGPTESVS
jgi:hypothetical protein